MDLLKHMTNYYLHPRELGSILLVCVTPRVIVELTKASDSSYKECCYCSRRVGPQNFTGQEYINCCQRCFDIQKRMFEYFRNRHPLLKNLSKLDYVDDKTRAEGFARECSALRGRLLYYIAELNRSLPLGKTPQMLIIVFCTKMIYRDNRITVDELIVGGEDVTIVW